MPAIIWTNLKREWLRRFPALNQPCLNPSPIPYCKILKSLILTRCHPRKHFICCININQIYFVTKI